MQQNKTGSKHLYVQKLFKNSNTKKIMVLCTKCNLSLQEPFVVNDVYVCPSCLERIQDSFLDNRHVTTFTPVKNTEIVETTNFIKFRILTIEYKFIPKAKRIIWANFCDIYVFNKKTLFCSNVKLSSNKKVVIRINLNKINEIYHNVPPKIFFVKIASFLSLDIKHYNRNKLIKKINCKILNIKYPNLSFVSEFLNISAINLYEELPAYERNKLKNILEFNNKKSYWVQILNQFFSLNNLKNSEISFLFDFKKNIKFIIFYSN